MGKNLAKKVSNLNKIPHPKGRKTAQLSKKTMRAAGREKVKLQHQMKMNVLGEKIMWFKTNLDPVESYSAELTINLIEKYLRRFDEELEQINLKHATGKRKGRQHASREDIIKMTIKNERNEFLTSGIEMPDVLNSKQLNLLRNWSGELRYIQNFKLVRYNKGKLEDMMRVKDTEKERKKSELSDEKKNIEVAEFETAKEKSELLDEKKNIDVAEVETAKEENSSMLMEVDS